MDSLKENNSLIMYEVNADLLDTPVELSSPENIGVKKWSFSGLYHLIITSVIGLGFFVLLICLFTLTFVVLYKKIKINFVGYLPCVHFLF